MATPRKYDRQTLQDIEQIDKRFLTAADIYNYLVTDPNLIRWQAHHNPEKLGFKVIVMGRRVKIPKDQFIAAMSVKKENTERGA